MKAKSGQVSLIVEERRTVKMTVITRDWFYSFEWENVDHDRGTKIKFRLVKRKWNILIVRESNSKKLRKNDSPLFSVDGIIGKEDKSRKETRVIPG